MSRTAGEKSKRALLEAAGKLYAKQGIEQVKLSDIAGEAGVDPCMIHYHFGGRDGLITAVLDQALERWKKIDMRNYYQENKTLLKSREGQKIFIAGLVESVFRTFGNGREEHPETSMLLQLMQYPNRIRDGIIERHIKPLVTLFCEIRRTITGNDDFEDAFCWFMFLVCPKFLHRSSPGMLDLFHPEGKISATFERRLQHYTTQVLLQGLGLN